ncbi:MAG: hypothetical protein J1G06_04600 [Oscillospiraceae bacterium]|nr:hypothetical protein [Oscillospiraceae bacterium]
MCSNPNDFSKYLVIFVDILGSKNRTNFQEMYKVNKIFHEEFEKNQKNDKLHTVYFRKIYTFSDCAYIFYGFKSGIADERKDLGKLFTVALCNCEPLFLRFLKEKIIFRGGISYGDAYIDPHRNMFFGDAVNRAYKLESETAIHPRIVIEEFVATKVMNNISMVKDTMRKQYMYFGGMMPKISETGDGIVEEDKDGEYIFNYLHSPENNISLTDCYIFGKVFIEELVDYCIEQINNNKQYKIIDKYYYLLRFSKDKLNNLLETEEN